MAKQIKKEEPKNFKEQNALHSFSVTIRDREHFYKIVNWLNENVGKGSECWTMQGRILKTLNTGKTVNPKIYIFKEEFDPTSTLYLTLI
jgi:hypothetical protein